MAIIVEDGTVVDGANSYGSVEGFTLYLSLRGFADSSSNAQKEYFLTQAMDYIESQRNRFQGRKVSSSQGTQFPRYGVIIDGMLLGSGEIPRELEYGQYALAYDISNGRDPLAYSDGKKGAVTKEKLGPMETTYSAPVNGLKSMPAFSKAHALLSVLYKRNGLHSVEILPR